MLFLPLRWHRVCICVWGGGVGGRCRWGGGGGGGVTENYHKLARLSAHGNQNGEQL